LLWFGDFHRIGRSFGEVLLGKSTMNCVATRSLCCLLYFAKM